jgi:hypothetical protein
MLSFPFPRKPNNNTEKLAISLLSQTAVTIVLFPLFTLSHYAALYIGPAPELAALGWRQLYAGLGADLARRAVFGLCRHLVLSHYSTF